MSDPTILAAALVTVIASVAGAIVTVINAITAARDRRESLAARESLTTKTDEIHHLVDGSATAAQRELTALQAKIDVLHGELGQLQERRVEDAKTKAAGDTA